MGFGAAEIEFLLWARSHGVDFQRTATLGRQVLTAGSRDLDRLAPGMATGFAEPFLQSLGAEDVRSLDYAGFDGATDSQDLNEPLDPALAHRFTAAIDGGTVEHVFNVPEALRSLLTLPRVGGHVLMMTPCNGSPGHGLYQFTPELLFRVFDHENGYRVRSMFLREDRHGWYRVSDPKVVGGRCEFSTKRTAYLFVAAERVSDVEVFRAWPAQSDYASAWQQHPGENQSGARAEASSVGRISAIVDRLPPKLRTAVFTVRARSWPPSYRRRRANFTPTSLLPDATGASRKA